MNPPLLARADASVLVIVDIQQRLATAMDPQTVAAVLRNSRLLLQAAALLNIPALATEQYPKGLGPTTPELLELLPEAAQRIEKTCFSCAGVDAFQSAVERHARPQIILAGMEAHVCVLQSALELRARFQEVFVVEDACCSRRPENHANAMHRLRSAGVTVANTESVLFEWLRDARHDKFKAVSAMLK